MRNFILLTLIGRASAAPSVIHVKLAEGAELRLQSELELRSDPSSDHYLSWLTREEVNSILAADPKHMKTVLEVVNRHGGRVDDVVGGRMVVAEFEAAASHSAFKAELAATGSADGISTPTHNTTTFEPRRVRSRAQQEGGIARPSSGDPQACLSDMNGVTITCLRKAYGLDSDGAANTSNLESPSGGQAVCVNQGFMPSDLVQFQQQFHLPSNAITNIVGGNDGKAGDEASLDTQYITGIGENVPTTYVYLDGSMDNPFTNWLVWAAKADDSMPKVHSLSVGAPEAAVGDSIIKSMNTEMAALGVRGITIVFASGDSGYQPQQKFGAASPYVTSVGGIYNGEMRQDPLQVDALTTGGFAASQLNKAGKWQAAAIASFLKTKGDRPANIDSSQRAVPDVSAYDDDIQIIQGGQQAALSGTSAAAPMVAGMLSLVNSALAAEGNGKSLGFANPFLYANEAAFLDITRGNNNGIQAVVGYDPVSGLGTFSPTTFDKLKKAALSAAKRAALARHASAKTDTSPLLLV